METKKLSLIMDFISKEGDLEFYRRLKEQGIETVTRDNFTLDTEISKGWKVSDFQNKDFLEELPMIFYKQRKQQMDDTYNVDSYLDEKKKKKKSVCYEDLIIPEEEKFLLVVFLIIIKDIINGELFKEYVNSISKITKFNQCNFQYHIKRNNTTKKCNKDAVPLGNGEKCLMHC